MFSGVEMEVILMVAVGLGAKNRAEGAASVLVQLAQDTALVTVVPMIQHSDVIAVAELYRGDVDGITFGVF